MGSLKRERPPIGTSSSSELLKSKANIELFAETINQVDKEFPGPPRKYSRFNFGKKEKTVMSNIIDWLSDLMADHGSDIPMPIILTDYLRCIYSAYGNFGRKPYFNQLSPSTTNMARFTDWAYEYHQIHDSSYWADFNMADVLKARKIARDALSREDISCDNPFDVDIDEV